MSEETEVKQKQGKPWTTVATYSTYTEASNKRLHMSAMEPTYNFKIRRSGQLGSQFTLKKRLDPKLDEAEKQLNQKSASLTKKTNKKSKKVVDKN